MIAQEEIFGSVVVLIGFDDEDDAIRIANGDRLWACGCGLVRGCVSGTSSGPLAAQWSGGDQPGAPTPAGAVRRIQTVGPRSGGWPVGIEEFLTYKSL